MKSYRLLNTNIIFETTIFRYFLNNHLVKNNRTNEKLEKIRYSTNYYTSYLQYISRTQGEESHSLDPRLKRYTGYIFKNLEKIISNEYNYCCTLYARISVQSGKTEIAYGFFCCTLRFFLLLLSIVLMDIRIMYSRYSFYRRVFSAKNTYVGKIKRDIGWFHTQRIVSSRTPI